MNNNEKGLMFEQKCFKKLKELGFTDLSLTKNTDNGADIRGSYKGTVYVFQCKDHLKPQGNKCVQEIVAARRLYKANRTVVISSSGFTPSAIALAKAHNCILISNEFFDLLDFPPLSYIDLLIKNDNVCEFDFDIVKFYTIKKNELNRTPKWEELDGHLRYQIRKTYKNYGTFLKTIGDKKFSEKHSDEDLKKEYNRIKEFIQKIPTLSDIKKYTAIPLNEFHSYPFTKLQRECGDRPFCERGISKEQLIDAYYLLENKIGHCPSICEMETQGEYHVSYYRNKWGNLNSFFEEIHKTRVQAGLSKIYTKEEILLIYLCLKLIFSVKTETIDAVVNHSTLEKLSYDDKSLISPSTISKKFGDWNNFINQWTQSRLDVVCQKISSKFKNGDGKEIFDLFKKLLY